MVWIVLLSSNGYSYVFSELNFDLIMCFYLTGASFSETFYGLRRVPMNVLSDPAKSDKLSPTQLTASLLLLTLFPYLRAKLKNAATKYRLEEGTAGAPKVKSFSHTVLMSNWWYIEKNIFFLFCF